MKPADFNDEERAVLIAGLNARMNQLRAGAKAKKAENYRPAEAREYHLAEELAERIAVAP